MDSAPEWRAAAEAFQTSTLGDLDAVRRRLNAEMNEGLAAHGFAGLGSESARVLSELGPAGDSVAGLARRQFMSASAMGRLVLQCEETGYVERAPDPDDLRAVRVQVTSRGRALITRAAEITSELEAALEQDFGVAALVDFAQLVRRLFRATGLGYPPSAAYIPADAIPSGLLQMHLHRVCIAARGELVRLGADTGLPFVESWDEVPWRLFASVPPDGMTIGALADATATTKQNASALAKRWIRAGCLESAAHPEDGRARLLRWTTSGQTVLVAAHACVREVEVGWLDELGQPGVRRLGDYAARLARPTRATEAEARFFRDALEQMQELARNTPGVDVDALFDGGRLRESAFLGLRRASADRCDAT